MKMPRTTKWLWVLAALGCGTTPADPGPDPGDNGPDPDPPNHDFTYTPPAGAPAVLSLSVRGSFNNWDEAPMGRQDGGSWRRSVNLPDGDHQYKFFVNGDWIGDMCYDPTWGDPGRGYAVDPNGRGCVDDGNGGQNAVVVIGTVPLDFQHTPGNPAQVSVAGGRISVRFRARQGTVVRATIVADGNTTEAVPQFVTGLHQIWRASLPTTTASYTIAVETAAGVTEFGPFSVPASLFTSVPWVEDAVGYQIFPERFWNGDPTNDHRATETDEFSFRDPALGGTQPVLTADWSGPVLEAHCCHQYFGGDLQGVIDKLDRLAALGVTVIYFNPIFAAGSAHGYDTFDYLQVAPNFGDTTVLRALVDATDARGMRLIWDFVPNHVGIGHYAFQDAIANGQASPYWDWFNFFVPADQIQAGNGNHYESWSGFGSLPELQTEVPAVFDHLMDVVRYWTEFGLDGIRVDVPNEIENRTAFFDTFRQTAKAANPEAYLVGEIWGREPGWLQGNWFDALMNYAIGNGVIERFARGDIGGGVAAREMAALYAAYPEASVAMMFNLVASHDTDRLLTKMGGGELGATAGAEAVARQRLAAAMLFALPGVPFTFQGDECAFLGGSGGRHTARYPMQWSACDASMTAHYTALANLKRTVDALASPVIRAYQTPGTLLSFYRGEPGAGELLAVFNNSVGAASLTLPAGTWSDLANGGTVQGTLAVERLGWRYLQRN